MIAITNKHSNNDLNHVSDRSKRQTSDSGDNLPVFDRAYGVDLDLKVFEFHNCDYDID